MAQRMLHAGQELPDQQHVMQHTPSVKIGACSDHMYEICWRVRLSRHQNLVEMLTCAGLMKARRPGVSAVRFEE
jgi:hypothetical protein